VTVHLYFKGGKSAKDKEREKREEKERRQSDGTWSPYPLIPIIPIFLAQPPHNRFRIVNAATPNSSACLLQRCP
jgi:hypothetical protein